MGIGRGNGKVVIDSNDLGTTYALEFHEALPCDDSGAFWDLHNAAVVSQAAFDTEATSQFGTRYSAKSTELKTAAREAFRRLADPGKKGS